MKSVRETVKKEKVMGVTWNREIVCVCVCVTERERGISKFEIKCMLYENVRNDMLRSSR